MSGGTRFVLGCGSGSAGGHTECGAAVQIGLENLSKELVPRGPQGQRVTLPKPDMTQALLIEYGNRLVEEQDNIKRVQLADEYLHGAALAGETGSSMPEGYAAA